MKWILGITDLHPARWKKVEPIWEDEQIIVSSSDSFNDVMCELCDTAIKSRREYDHGINEHMWNMKVMPLNEAVNPNLREQRILRMLMDVDENNESTRKTIVIESPAHENMRDYDEPGEMVMPGSTSLHEDLLPIGSVIKVTYDYGSTTELYLKVLSITGTNAGSSVIQHSTPNEDNLKDLEDVPAYKLPKDRQVDHFFPFASKAFLGHYIPLHKQARDDDEYLPFEQNKTAQ
jgi:hypothetical protein